MSTENRLKRLRAEKTAKEADGLRKDRDFEKALKKYQTAIAEDPSYD